MITFDSNILVYAADQTAGHRHEEAASLVERAILAGNCTLSLQVLAEFFNVATRKIGTNPIIAAEFVDGWQAVLATEPANSSDLVNAMRAVREHGLAFWDAMLWATVRRVGVGLLITEDFQDGRILEGVRFVNPFLAHNDPTIRRELDR